MAARRRKRGVGWKGQIFLILMLLGSIMFSALSVVLAVGMVPTIVTGIMDRSVGWAKTMTIGMMNFAGCVPFMLDVFNKGNDISTALSYVFEPRTIVVMYMAAGMGHMIDWAMTGIVSSIMVQRAKARVKEIEKQKTELVDRWGPEVTGRIPLDEFGFPRESVVLKEEEA